MGGKAVPKKMTAEAKKKFVKDSIDWLRENDPGRLDTVDDETAKAFTELAGIPYEGRSLSSQEEKRNVMENALNWIRNNDPEIEADPRVGLVNALSKLTGKPVPKKMLQKEKKKFVEDSIAWLRNNDPGMPNAVDDKTAKSFAELAGIPYEGRPSTLQERKRRAME